MELTSAPILGEAMQLRWKRLVVLADEASSAGLLHGDDEALTRTAGALAEHASALHEELTALALS